MRNMMNASIGRQVRKKRRIKGTNVGDRQNCGTPTKDMGLMAAVRSGRIDDGQHFYCMPRRSRLYYCARG